MLRHLHLGLVEVEEEKYQKDVYQLLRFLQQMMDVEMEKMM